jgi:hypothetical protein
MTDSAPTPDLAAAFAKAAAIAKSVPENLQEIAFQRALDALLASAVPAAAPLRPPPAKAGRGATKSARPVSHQAAASGGNRAERLIALIDRTEGAQIVSTGRALDKALLVLRAAHQHGIEAMTPGEIAKVLTDKFRERTSAPAVRMALGGDKTFTDRRRDGAGFAYKLMAPGERHLEGLENGTISISQPMPKRSSPRKAAATVKNNSAAAAGKKASPKGTRARSEAYATRTSTSGRPGPKAVLEVLIAQGYFSESRALGEIIDHLQAKKGHRYKPTDLSPALARLLREEKLDRDRDSNGQYRYVRRS